MTCTMCPRTDHMTRELGYMNEALFQRIINEISPFSAGIFLHHFGDSLVHPKLAEHVAYAHSHGIKTYISGNPILLTEKRAGDLIDAGLHELVLSLDAFTSTTSAAIRGNAARNVEAAEQRIRTFLQLRKARGSRTPYLIVQIVRQKQNEHEVVQWLKKWSAVKEIDQIKVKSYVSWDGQDEYINSLRLTQVPDPSGLICDKPWTSVTILWDGRVVPCCFDYDAIYVLGDLRTQTLRDIWNGERMRLLRQTHRSGNLEGIRLCKRCTDKEGYPVGKWYYPLNRWLGRHSPLGDEDAVPLPLVDG